MVWIVILVFFALILACASPTERAATLTAEAALLRLESVARALPATNELRTISCPEGLASRALGYSPVDRGFFSQFTGGRA